MRSAGVLRPVVSVALAGCDAESKRSLNEVDRLRRQVPWHPAAFVVFALELCLSTESS